MLNVFPVLRIAYVALNFSVESVIGWHDYGVSLKGYGIGRQSARNLDDKALALDKVEVGRRPLQPQALT